MLGRARPRMPRLLGRDPLIDERQVRARGGRCAPFRLQVFKRRGTTNLPDGVRVVAVDALGNTIGEMQADWNIPSKSLDIYWAETTKPSCGVGTRMYEAMAREACTRMMSLRSDTRLSKYSRGFWEKQVKKGRAEFQPVSKRFRLETCELNLEGRRGRGR